VLATVVRGVLGVWLACVAQGLMLSCEDSLDSEVGHTVATLDLLGLLPHLKIKLRRTWLSQEGLHGCLGMIEVLARVSDSFCDHRMPLSVLPHVVTEG